jgi:hypothetical protein
MLERIKNWLKARLSMAGSSQTGSFQKTGAYYVERPKNPVKLQPRDYALEADAPLAVDIEDGGPGKNVLTRTKYVREDTGTHETLKILDDSLVDSDEESGIDPYNTGGFDRSKNWNTRFRK